jgi:low temperature requirement protein LtrA
MGDKSPRSLLRTRSAGRVTNMELFFDLIYVFAVTQLSHHLLDHRSIDGALQTALLLVMVWLLWAYTTWVTNWLDPDLLPLRLMLVSAMLVSLVMSTALPDAFARRGLWVGVAYAVMQVGRSTFAVVGFRGERLQTNFERILAWCVVSGALAVIGGFEHGWARGGLWAAAVGVDLLGGAIGFYTPGLGRSTTAEWTIEGSHFAERCQAFLLIALGESIVVIGATFSGLRRVTGGAVGAFVAAFVGAVALWWIYFDRSADEGAHIIAHSKDPGRLGRSAYHFVHPIMVAGIIVTAAADQKVLSHPLAKTGAATAWMILGGTGLFLAGHSAFKAIVWRVAPWTRLVAIAIICLFALLAAHVSSLALGGCTTAVVLAVALTDRVHPGPTSRQRVSGSHRSA